MAASARPEAGDLAAQFGNIDIYLFDQLLRGRIRPGMRILDAGCGGGRNLVYFLKNGFDILAADADPVAIASVCTMAASLAPHLDTEKFHVEPVEAMTFPDACADVVISNAVLHFARNDDHFDAMVRGMWRVLKPGGMLFSRLASTIGMAERMQPIRGRRYHLPDGSDRYLVDEAMLVALTARLGATQLDPLKTTVVQDQRAMTTWVIRKPDRQ
jgi:tellurite methyltransferase